MEQPTKHHHPENHIFLKLPGQEAKGIRQIAAGPGASDLV